MILWRSALLTDSSQFQVTLCISIIECLHGDDSRKVAFEGQELSSRKSSDTPCAAIFHVLHGYQKHTRVVRLIFVRALLSLHTFCSWRVPCWILFRTAVSGTWLSWKCGIQSGSTLISVSTNLVPNLTACKFTWTQAAGKHEIEISKIPVPAASGLIPEVVQART